jgi:hypothetical protein
MISIITSTYKPIDFEHFNKNVSETIGVPYEMVKMDNPGLMSLAMAYNKAAALAKYPILCFIHDDVAFETENWGQRLIDHLNQPGTGVVGLAGATYKPAMISSWKLPEGKFNFNRYHYIQGYKFENRKEQHFLNNPDHLVREQVITLDGVFLAVKKDVHHQHPFDEQLLTGFHGYDLDYSLNIARQFRNYVCYDITLKHFSEGKADIAWLENTLKVHRKHAAFLPMAIAPLPAEEIRYLENEMLIHFLYLLRKILPGRKQRLQYIKCILKEHNNIRPGLRFWYHLSKTYIK